MEAAISTVVGVFLKSSKGKENLGGKEFQGLVKSQLKNILTDSEDNDAVKEMRQQLDGNKDGKVSFQEYMTLVGYLAKALSEQRCLENETQAEESSTQETQPEAAANAQAEPPKAMEAEKPDKPVSEEAKAEEKKPEEEKQTEGEQEGATVEENKAEDEKKTEEAS